MPTQRTHSNSVFESHKFPIVVICDGVHSPANIGGLFRISDALGVQEIIFCGPNIDFSSPRLKKTARETYKTVQYSQSDEIIIEIDKLKAASFNIVALEITDKSIPLESFSVENKPIALIIGNEQNGISQTVLESVSNHIHINMHGKNSSMNVVQATGIALYFLIHNLK